MLIKKSFLKSTLALCLGIVMITFSLSSCKLKDEIKYPEYTVVVNSELGCAELHHDGIVFRHYGSSKNNGLGGKQIGIRESDFDNKICEV